MNHRLVELGADSWGGVLCSENIADLRPGGTGFANLRTNCLYVVVVLGEKTPKILEDVNRLEHLIVNGELFTKRKGGSNRHVPLMPLFGPSAAFLGVDVHRVRRVALHPAPFATGIKTLVL